ncbi:sulfite exporter TauE/SafE family protein [Asticcacaulis sp. BYS171W]|uniref:Sulfite exporter TauE/SafE family protein n=1 Tax=Asticcacaulis aquaticus TaxID=2984212 RepID=A0ABT5HWM6_9CAUL|nr:sulfite exporter TauE/SafE family protein [Asticcacaulis aquaticus]MDC7684476.1 sulfite exporter TauE/SafE family protein [Asticcacaulis aquaticus]
MELSNHWLATCGQIIEGQKTLFFVMFFAGLTGSVAHCLTMCGPFVLMQTAANTAKTGWIRLLLPYHAGRLTTYSALGALAGGTLLFLSPHPEFELLRRVLLALVATAFLFILIESLLARVGLRLPFRFGIGIPCGLKAFGRLAATKNVLPRYALGLALGLLPCGLLLTALLAAATTANPLRGAVAMLLFGLGTVPALAGLGWFGGPILKRWPWLQDALRLSALGINACLLFALSLRPQ